MTWGAALAAAVALAPTLSSTEAVALTPGDREAVARVAYAEAGGQGDSGLAGVVFTILNRLSSGQWGNSVERVVNARGQFEPVMRAGGGWRGLRPVTPAQQARIDTILNLAVEGRLPDLTGGARYFQNPTVVAARAAAGTVSPRLVNFGGATPSAVIGGHSFYIRLGPGSAHADRGEAAQGARPAMTPPRAAVGVRGLFVLPDGQIIEDPARNIPTRAP